MNEYWPNRDSTGKPKYYANWDQDRLYLAPTPNSAYKIELALNKQPTGLSSTNTSTWVSTNAPKVLLYACLVEAYGYLKGPIDMLQYYEAAYKRALASYSIEQEGRRRRDEYQDGVIRNVIKSPSP